MDPTAPMNIVIRPYRETDRPTLHALTVDAFEGVSIDRNIDRLLGPVAGRDWRLRKTRHLDEDIDATDSEVAVAEEAGGGRTVGYVTLLYDRATRIGWIHHMAVVADLRGHGLGRRLLEHALGRLRAERMTIARIETLEQNPVGRHLFPTLGFREVARQIYYAMRLDGDGTESDD